MAVTVHTVVDDRIATYVNRLTAHRGTTEAAVLRDLVERGYDQVLRHLHDHYQRGELTFRAVAEELGLSVRELYDVLEQKGLPT